MSILIFFFFFFYIFKTKKKYKEQKNIFKKNFEKPEPPSVDVLIQNIFKIFKAQNPNKKTP